MSDWIRLDLANDWFDNSCIDKWRDYYKIINIIYD